MKEYLSHFSAASYWNIPCLRTVLGFELSETYPVDLTISIDKSRAKSNDRQLHTCSVALPAGSIVSKDGCRVASPELVFLQLACKLSIHQTILLGLQLCSYSPVHPSTALTTKQKLKTFLAKTSGYNGQVNALQAVKYLEDGSASIMESMVYMIMALPHSLGGYGLRNAVFNHEIKLKGEAGKRLKQNSCFVDLYYKAERVAVEYDSFAFHSSPSKQGKDSIRSVILDMQGVDVMHLHTIQLYDQAACKDFAFALASRLGRRIQIRTEKFDEMDQQLRALLPTRQSGINGELTLP